MCRASIGVAASAPPAPFASRLLRTESIFPLSGPGARWGPLPEPRAWSEHFPRAIVRNRQLRKAGGFDHAWRFVVGHAWPRTVIVANSWRTRDRPWSANGP